MTIASLLLEPPTNAGQLVGQDDWSLVVEILLPAESSGVWGVDLWGETLWAEMVWADVTDKVRGMEWTRGSDEVFGRPRVGQIILTLDDNDGTLSPWTATSAQFLGPGTVLRAGLVSPTGIVDPDFGTVTWLPQWTGIVAAWTPIIVTAQIADRYVQLTLNETVRDLAGVDEPALSSPVGSGEGASARAERLLDAAAWRYGYLCEAQNCSPAPSTQYPLQSTVMAQNRLSELYLVADSSDTVFRSIRDGRAALTASEYISNDGPPDVAVWPLALTSWFAVNGERVPAIYLASADDEVTSGATYDLTVCAYRPETFISQSVDDEVSNYVSLAAVGMTPQTFRQESSIQRFGQRSYLRSDLLNATGQEATVYQIAYYTSIRRALATLRIEAVTVDTWARPLRQFLSLVSAEPTDQAVITSPLLGPLTPEFLVDPDTGDYLVDPDTGDYLVTPGDGLPQPQIAGRIAQLVHRVTPRVPGSSMIWETDIRIDTREVRFIPGAQLDSSPF